MKVELRAIPFLKRHIRQKPAMSREIISKNLGALQAFPKIPKTVPATHLIIHGIMPIIPGVIAIIL